MPDIVLDTHFNNPLLRTADTLVFRDTFDRPDGNLIGQLTPRGKRPWLSRSDGSAAVKSAVIRGGRAGILTETTNAMLFALVDAGTPDGIYEVDFITGEGNSNNVLPFRVQTVNNCLMLIVTSGKWTLRKRVSGTYTTLGVSAIAKADGQRIRIVLSGPSIRIYINGALAFAVTETDHMDQTMFGIGGLAASLTVPVTLWDNISFTIPGV